MKRIIDLSLSLALLLLFSPILILVALLVRFLIGRPVLFRQKRPGLGGEPFEMLKFRSMTEATGSDGAPLPDSDRLTTLGRFLRASSLDELPGLINVVRGEMSMVGPRPLLMQYVPLYDEFQSRRHEVRPGITGWAQINGRNSLSWNEKFEHDVWYVDNRTILLDFKILLLTAIKVFRRDGITAAGDATMPIFRGNGTHT